MADTHSYNPSLSHKDATKAISSLGVAKVNTRAWQLFLLGILAGLYIGFGGQLFLVTVASGLGKVIGALMFSVGLILVVVAGAELFTGNAAIIVGVLTGRVSKRRMLKNWLVVYVGNFVGSVVFAVLMAESGLFDADGGLNKLGTLASNVADAKIAIPFWEAFIRGVFCNMLVVLAIVMAVMAKDIVSKIFCIIFPITCFVACEFEHCVANMYLVTVGMLVDGTPLWETYPMFTNLIPVTLGNIAGGLAILLIHPNRIRQINVLLKTTKDAE